MIRPPRLTIILFAIVCIAWGACTQERQPCLTPKKATLIVNSIHFASDTAVVPVDSLLPHAMFIPASANALLYFDYTTAASLFGISLSPDSTFCQWVVQTDSSLNMYDTLSFYYKKNLKFLSNACGYTYFYSIDSVHTTHHFIDSLHIINPGVTNVTNNVKNVQIYITHNF